MKSGLVAVIAVVCLVGSAGATYLFVNEMNQSEYESEISSMNEFDRLILKARDVLDATWLNRGYAEVYQYEADYGYSVGFYGVAEVYYAFARDYFAYAMEIYGDAKLIFQQAEDNATNDKTLEFTQKYIEYIDSSRELLSFNYVICNNLQLVCYYYNLSEWDTGDGFLADINAAVAERNDFMNAYSDLLGEIKLMLDASWIE